MRYKLVIELEENIQKYNEDIMVFMEFCDANFNVISKELSFFKKNDADTFNTNELTSDIVYIFKEDKKDFEDKIHKLLVSKKYIKRYSLNIVDEKKKENSSLYLNPVQIHEIGNRLENLVDVFSGFELDDKKTEKFLNLSYELKKSIYNLQIVDLEGIMFKLEKKFLEYAKSFGIELEFKYEISSLKLDKVIFSKLNSVLTEYIYILIDSEFEKIEKEFKRQKLEIKVQMSQKFNKLHLNVYCNHLEKYNIKDVDLDKMQDDNLNVYQNLSLVNIYNQLKLLGTLDYLEKNCMTVKINLDFFVLDSKIVKSDIGNIAIPNENISKISEYESENVAEISGIKYYVQNNLFIPILNFKKEAKYAIQVKIKNQDFIYFAKEILFDEEVYITNTKNIHDKYIGKVILKNNERAFVLNLKYYLGEIYG